MNENTGRREEFNTLPSLYSIFQGRVASLQPYGAFVRLPGCRKNGLVHKTQISKMKIDNPSDVLEVGDDVYCKVISLGESGDDKISLSMKVVNQDNGNDLDENLIITKQEEQRRKKGLPPVQNRIELGAILNTVCKKCGMKGHLTQDCFKLPGDKTYELVPELDLDSNIQPLVQSEKKGKKKKKKDKHKKKRKKTTSTSKDGESSGEEEDTKRKSRQEKRRRKRESSKDSSGSSSHEENMRVKERNVTGKKKGYRPEEKRKLSSDSEDSRKKRIEKRDGGYSNDDYRRKEKHHTGTSKHPYSDDSDEYSKRHSKDSRQKDHHRHDDRR